MLITNRENELSDYAKHLYMIALTIFSKNVFNKSLVINWGL